MVAHRSVEQQGLVDRDYLPAPLTHQEEEELSCEEEKVGTRPRPGTPTKECPFSLACAALCCDVPGAPGGQPGARQVPVPMKPGIGSRLWTKVRHGGGGHFAEHRGID
ncbi:hypothetical protein COCON_G00177910 [Conger conger]|uniref:Uncharacterized protein n=1 Tax=Conger conger TaxID=82655 RepID=A0A9Q1HST6_CONCO|nr:hypothetical protein COCON_G00177910 [Conger conger]